MRTLYDLVTVAAAAAVLCGGCGVGEEPSAEEHAQKEADAVGGELTAKATGITVWLDPVAEPTTRFGQPAWVLRGRASKNIEGVFSFSSDDELGEAIQVSPRKFDIFIDAGQAEHLIAGYRLLLDLDASTGSTRQYFASIRLASRFHDFHGSSKLTLHKTVTPYMFGDVIQFRNLIGVASGYQNLGAVTEAGASPVAIGPSGSSFAMDWSGAGLVAAAVSADSEIAVSAQKGSQTATRFQSTELYVKSLQLIAGGMPLEVWPDPTCTPSVRACLQALPAGELDRSSCGAAIDVRPCADEVATPISAPRFQANLQDHLVTWYADHGADVAAAGGNSLAAAQALCSAASVEQVMDPEDDPEGHDLGRFIVFRHPDVVFPGSDIAWFGAYDRATGALVSIYDFN